MSIPDWTQAHDQATHYDTLRDVFCNYNFWWHKNKQILMCNRDWGAKRYTPRPVGPIDTAWDGTGLPPVGTECEMDFGIKVAVEDLSLVCRAPEGTSVKITGSADFGNGPVAVFEGRLGSGSWFYGFHRRRAFRPIRTQAQTDREELIRIATQVLIHDDVITEQNAAEALYDAGMLRRAGE